MRRNYTEQTQERRSTKTLSYFSRGQTLREWRRSPERRGAAEGAAEGVAGPTNESPQNLELSVPKSKICSS